MNRPGAGGPHGILLVDKAPGVTSHDVVARTRRLLGTRRVGHAGTLDPMATGLLVLGIGQGTRLLTHLVGLGKTYTATIRLGCATTTDDREGEVLDPVTDAGGVTGVAIERALESLRGDIQQVPSTVSAIKVDGQRAYARVRAGEDVELAPRAVRIDRFEVLADRREGAFRDLDVVVECSSGTYVRALARDLGAALGVGGHLTALRRTRVGPFDVEDAVTVPGRGEGDDADLPLAGLGRIASRVMDPLPVDEPTARDLGHGKHPRSPEHPPSPEDPGPHPGPPRADLPGRDGALRAAVDAEGRLVAVVRATGTGAGRTLVPVLVIAPDGRC